MKKHRWNRKGFTLIELLVVIAIIGLLATLAMIRLDNARKNTRDAVRFSDLRTMQSVLEIYVSQNGRAPAVSAMSAWNDLMVVLAEYLAGKIIEPPPSSLPNCPASGTLPDQWRTANCYFYCANAIGQYLIGGRVEGPAINGDIDTNIQFLANECINTKNNKNSFDFVFNICRDNAAANVFCLEKK